MIPNHVKDFYGWAIESTSLSRNKSLLVSLLALLASSAQADSLPNKEQPNKWSHDFTLGLEGFKYHYDESTEEQPKFMQDKGVLYGAHGAYQLTYGDMVFLRPEARIAYGRTDYSNHKGPTYDKHSIPAIVTETRLLIGSPLAATSFLTLSPYTGIGYRHKWDDNTNIKNKVNALGLKRINKLWYLPVGARFEYKFNDQWFLQGMAEYDWVIKGEQLGYSKRYSPNPIVVKQKRGWGLKGEVLVGHHFNNVSVAFGPYIHYWKIRKSNTVRITYYSDSGVVFRNQPAHEPENKTMELGVKLSFVF